MKRAKPKRKKNLNHVKRQYKVRKAKRRMAGLAKKPMRNWQKMRQKKLRRRRIKS